jgi:uncharacterized protein YbbC (DUF1343 family)
MEGRRNKKWIVRLGAFWLCFATAYASVELGINTPAGRDYSLLTGKRVDLITNQAGVNADGSKTRLFLERLCTLVALQTPKHELDGTENAAHYVKSRRDPFTGVIAHSLGGPTCEMLRGIGVSEGESPQRIIADWRPNEQEFLRSCAQHLLY